MGKIQCKDLYDGKCNKTCQTGQFQCKSNKICIQNIHVCDMIEDCADGSDELNCSKFFLFLEN